MAQASFALDEARLCCSICLELFKDPVTIPCGHSYCMSCLTDLWDHEQTCSCPQCRASFSPRPTLGRNNLLVEMLQSFRALKLSAAPSAPPLYQEEYSFEHPTFDVSSVQPERTDGERLLGETRRRLAQQIQEWESEHQHLKQAMRSFSRLAKTAVKDSSRLFSELLEFVERRRVEMKEIIRAQEKAELTRAENQLQRLEQRISELKRKDTELEKVSHTQDQCLITQTCQSFGTLLAAGAPNSLKVNPNISFGPVRRTISDLKQQLESLYQKELHNVTSTVKSVNILQMQKTSKGTCESASLPDLDSRSHLLQYFCPLSLDPFTAHKELLLTKGNRIVSRTGQLQSYPDHPERFDTWGQVLGHEGLQGRRYWEVEWEGTQVSVGVTYSSIGRKGSSNECRLGHNALSWSLKCSASSFAFCHGNEEQAVVIPSSAVSRRIGVFLDHDAGLLCFFTVTSSGVHLMLRLQISFTEALYPAVWLGSNSTVTFCTVD